MPSGYARICYLANKGKAYGQYGPFELQFEAWDSLLTNPIFNCWDNGSPNTQYGTPACNICPDTNPNDSVLECDLPLPTGTKNFQFNVRKYDPQTMITKFWWGDKVNYIDGGCGNTNGTFMVTVTGPNGNGNVNPTELLTDYGKQNNLELYNAFIATIPSGP